MTEILLAVIFMCSMWTIKRQLLALLGHLGGDCLRAMQVENPIPFADPQTAKLTTGFLHAKYFHLLLFPWNLSADWSFACIPYLHTLSDPRNAATAAMYAALLWVIIAGRPWKILASILCGSQPAAAVTSPAQHADLTPAMMAHPLLHDNNAKASQRCVNGAAACGTDAQEADKRRQAVWQMVVVVGLMIGPFVPAANIFFYVGTFIGERLLYLPSLGYCIMLAHFLFKLLGPRGMHSLHSITVHLGLSQPASMPGAFGSVPAEHAVPAEPARPAVPAASTGPEVTPSRADSNTAAENRARLPYCKSTQQDAQQRHQQQQQQQQTQEDRLGAHSQEPTGQSEQGSRNVRGWIGLALVGLLLVGYSWRTVVRNRDWQDEETLFLAAQKVNSHVTLAFVPMITNEHHHTTSL